MPSSGDEILRHRIGAVLELVEQRRGLIGEWRSNIEDVVQTDEDFTAPIGIVRHVKIECRIRVECVLRAIEVNRVERACANHEVVVDRTALEPAQIQRAG